MIDCCDDMTDPAARSSMCFMPSVKAASACEHRWKLAPAAREQGMIHCPYSSLPPLLSIISVLAAALLLLVPSPTPYIFFPKCSMFFGSKDDAPGGDLDRITVKKFPDQYPAEKILQAEPVKGDSKDMAVIRPLLKQTELGVRSEAAVIVIVAAAVVAVFTWKICSGLCPVESLLSPVVRLLSPVVRLLSPVVRLLSPAVRMIQTGSSLSCRRVDRVSATRRARNKEKYVVY